MNMDYFWESTNLRISFDIGLSKIKKNSSERFIQFYH